MKKFFQLTVTLIIKRLLIEHLVTRSINVDGCMVENIL